MRATTLLKVAPLVAERVQEFDGTRPYLATGDVGDEVNIRPTWVTYAERPSRADLTVRPGDVCFARMAATKKVLEITEDQQDVILSTGFAVLRPDKSIVHSGYLRHWLGSDQFQASKDRLSSGATQKAITNEKMSLLTIPLPDSVRDQVRIAERLDKAEALRAKCRAALAQLDGITQSIFLDMFGDPATNPKGWPRATLRELGKVKTGGTPPSAKQGMFNGPIPFVTPGDLESDVPAKRSVTEAGAAESESVRPGATLVCCIGATIGKIGRAAVRSAFNQQINAVEWGEAVHDTYGYEVLRFFKPTIVMWGASTTLPILKKSAFEKIEIPVPPIEVQVEFAARAAKVEASACTLGAMRAKCEDLCASLQARAFRGEL